MAMTRAMSEEEQRQAHHYSTSMGEVALPIRYYDGYNLVALFKVYPERAAGVLKGTGVKPHIVDDHALVVLSLYEYRETAIGPYNEVGVAVLGTAESETPPSLSYVDLLKNPRKRRIGSYVVDLPVTSEMACVAGKEIWGFPKFVTRIPLDYGQHHCHCGVQDPEEDEMIMSMDVRWKWSLPLLKNHLKTFSNKNDQLLKAMVDVHPRYQVCFGSEIELRVGESPHPMAERLRTFGLDNTEQWEPVAVMATNRFNSALHGGEAVI